MKTKSISFIVCFLAVLAEIHAQNLRILDMSNQADITGATIIIQSQDNQGWVGHETLDLFIKVVNVSSSTLVIGAKKIELDTLQADVQHTICFGGFCYPPAIFVSPNYVTLTAGAADSGFVAHYLFDNAVHIRGLNHVSYVFYDVNNPNDSVMVHVTYNSVAIIGIEEQNNQSISIYPFPNPASSAVAFQSDRPFERTLDTRFLITNAFGDFVATTRFDVNDRQFSFNTSTLPSGIYYYKFFEKSHAIATGKIMVSH